MKKFNYKFESILRVKENFKKQVMKEVAIIGKRIEENIEKKEILIKELNECKLNRNKSSMKISELQFLESHVYFLSKKIQFLDHEMERLKLQMKMKQNELLEKTKESKIFQKMKEAKYIAHRMEENQEENKMLDELAIQKASRN